MLPGAGLGVDSELAEEPAQFREHIAMTLRQRYLRLTFWNKFALWGSIASFAGLGVGLWPMLLGESRPTLKVAHSIATHSVRVEAREGSGFATVATMDVLAACVERMILVHGALDDVVVRQGSLEILRRFELSNDSQIPLTNLRLVIYKMEGGHEEFSVSPQIEATTSDYTPADAHAGRMKAFLIPLLPPMERAIVSYRVRLPDPGDAQRGLASLPDPTFVTLSAQELAQDEILVEPMTYVAMNASEQRVLKARLPIEPFETTDQFSILRPSADIYEIVPDSQLGPGGRFACRTPDGKQKPATNTNLFRADLLPR